MSKSRKQEPPASLAESLQRLEEIVSSLESAELDLDDALRLFEEGIGLLRGARDQVAGAEVKVQQVLENAEGELQLRDLDI
jgi:exodeoxyribonuclease VII small subunit